MISGRHSFAGIRLTRRGVSSIGLALAIPSLAVGLLVTAGVAKAPVASAASTPRLPFDMPALSTSSKLVFAHYLPSLVLSLDNKTPASDYYTVNYLAPRGEGGAHAAYGGFIRDRPVGRAVSASASWRLLDMETEVRQAMAAGIDGFALDLLTVNTSAQVWTNMKLLLQAARNVSPTFKIMLQPDMSALASKDAATVAKATALLAAYPSAYNLNDGRLVVAPFYAENKSIAWWTSYKSIMASTYGQTVALFPVVQNDQVYAKAFAPISIGIGNWGSRNPQWNPPNATYSTSPRGRVAAVHAMGKMWMQPVSVQDERPNQGVFEEPLNTQNMRDTWQIARDSSAEWVLLPTWNDYTEGTSIEPSAKHGWAFLDLMSYYITWFKTGRAPTIVRDAAYLTHRSQPWRAAQSFPQTRLMRLRGGSPARDTVESLNFLTGPATVSVTVGGVTTTCSEPAGVSSCLAPLRPGTVSVRVTRSGATVAAVTSPVVVSARPYVQDLQYIATSSLRSGSTAVQSPTTPPAPAPAPSTGAAGTTTRITPSSVDVAVHGTVTFNATVSPAAAGQVQFSVGGQHYGAVHRLASGRVSASLNFPSSGNRVVTAAFTPDNAASFTRSASAPVTIAVGVAPTVTRAAAVAGAVRVGSVATCSAAVTGGTAAYRWTLNGARIASTKRALVVPASYLGRRIACKVTVHNRVGTTSTSSPSVLVRVGVAPVARVRPAIRGAAVVGRVVTVAAVPWTVHPAYYRYVYRVDGKVVALMSRSSLRLSSAWRGKSLVIEVRAYAAGHVMGVARTSAVRIR